MSKKHAFLASLCASACMTGLAYADAPATWETGNLHTVSLIMSEPMMKVDGGYHELIDGLYLKPKMSEDKIVTAPLRDIMDELNGTMVFDGQTVTYQLDNKTVTMSLGSKDATINGEKVEAPVAPEMDGDALYVPFRFVMQGLGGKYSWNSKREMAEVILLRPKDAMFKPVSGKINRKTILKQEPEWFASDEAMKVAKGIVANQNDDGGWFKLGGSDDLASVVDREKFATYRQKSSIDNNATTYQIEALSRVYKHNKDDQIKQSMLKGITYLLDGQYDNGGWPQFFPVTVGYHKHVTFNDNAISNVLDLLRDVANKTDDFAFVPDDLVKRAQAAVEKGIALILKNQVVVNGEKTGWCAQYESQSLECIRGRSYELASISGDESVKVVKFLMSIKNPSQDVIDAVNSAVAFLDNERIEGKKMVRVPDVSLEFGRNRIVIDDPDSTVWPRFINLETLAPLFSNRQGDRLDKFEDVSYERREKYSWLVTSPGKLMEKDYPKWQAKYSPDLNILEQ